MTMDTTNRETTTAEKFSQLSPAAALAYLLALPHTDADGEMTLMTPGAMADLVAPGHERIAKAMVSIMTEWVVVRLATIGQDGRRDVLTLEIIGGAI